MSTIILDIETTVDKSLVDTYLANIKVPKTYKTKEAIDNYIESKKTDVFKSMAVDWDYSNILLIGIKELDQPARMISLEEFGALFDNPKTLFVTFKGKSFDIPVLIRNGIKKGVNLPYRKMVDSIKKFNYNGKLVDIMESLSKWGDYKSLDTYLQIYFGIKKTPINFETCSIEELTAHCVEDLENTEKMYNKFLPIL